MRRIKILLILALVLVTAVYVKCNVGRWLFGEAEGPEFTCSGEVFEVSVFQDESALLAGVHASDRQDGDLTDRIMVGSVSKLISEDTAKVTYLVFDSDENMASFERYIRYMDYHRPEIRLAKPLTFASVSNTNFMECLVAKDVIDGDISDLVRVSTLSSTEYPDIYQITAQVTNSMGDTNRVELPVIITGADTDLPQINLKSYLVYVEQGSDFQARDYLHSVTASRKTFSVADVECSGDVDTQTPGNYWVYYTFVYDNLVSRAILTVVVQ